MGQPAVLLAFFIVSTAMSTLAISNVDNIMSCMFCEIITETLEKETTPTGAIQSMFKRCNRMGLMEPVCDQFVSENAKRIFIVAKTGVPTAAICERMHLCGDTR